MTNFLFFNRLLLNLLLILQIYVKNPI